MFEVYLTNFGYPLERQCMTLEEAIQFGKSRGFEFSVYEIDDDGNKSMKYSWQVFSGGRYI